MGVYVAVRTPSAGSLVGDLVQRHPGSRVTSVPAGPQRGERLDHLALIEGVPQREVAQLLLAWNLRYGMPAEVLGDPFALRLPVLVPAAIRPWDRVLASERSLAVAGAVVEGDHIEMWYRCEDAGQAQSVAARLRHAVAGSAGAEVDEGSPQRRDAECWAILHEAIALDWPAASAARGPPAPQLAS